MYTSSLYQKRVGILTSNPYLLYSIPPNLNQNPSVYPNWCFTPWTTLHPPFIPQTQHSRLTSPTVLSLFDHPSPPPSSSAPFLPSSPHTPPFSNPHAISLIFTDLWQILSKDAISVALAESLKGFGWKPLKSLKGLRLEATIWNMSHILPSTSLSTTTLLFYPILCPIPTPLQPQPPSSLPLSRERGSEIPSLWFV